MSYGRRRCWERNTKIQGFAQIPRLCYVKRKEQIAAPDAEEQQSFVFSPCLHSRIEGDCILGHL